MAHQPARSISAALRRERPLRRSDLLVPPGSVELGPPSPRGPVYVRPRAVDVGDATAPEEPLPREEPAVAAAPDDTEPATPPPLSPLPPGVRVPQGEEREVLLARIQARVISSSSESEESDDSAPPDDEEPDAAPTPEEPAVVIAAAPGDAEPASLQTPDADPETAPPRHKPLQQRVSPRSVLLVPDEEETVDVDVYVEEEDEVEDRLTTLRKRGYLAFYDRPPLMTVALVLSWIFVQRRRGYPPYDEDTYCLGPDTPFRTVFAHAYAHSSKEHLYSNVVCMLLVGVVLEAVEGPLCVFCIFACAVPCGAAYHSLWKPHAFVRGASGGVYGVMAAHVSTMLMNWHEMPLRYFRLLACVLVIAAEVAGRYWYRQPHLGYAAHFGGAVGGAAAALVLVRNVRLRCHEFAFLFVGLVVYAASAVAVVYYAGDSRPALGMALVSPPLAMQLGMTSCSYDGDDSVLEPGARVFDLSAWKALCCRRPPAIDDDGGDEVV